MRRPSGPEQQAMHWVKGLEYSVENSVGEIGFMLKKYELAVFITGAAILSLEVLASRIMTPYFGVSLYIWSGILSITLIFLAIGYRLGGRVSADGRLASIEYRLLAAPVVSGVAILVSAIAYPLVLPLLSRASLVVGSFVGATLLLALPLIALSAMNPLLISLQRSETASGDAGAGRIFFISTIGSVAGVLFTTFAFIPHMTNFRAILVLAIGVCLVSLALVAFAEHITSGNRRTILVSAIVVSVLSTGLLAGKASYMELISATSRFDYSFSIKAEYSSMFGNIKVAEMTRADEPDFYEKYFFQDGLVQNRTDAENKSISMYTYVLESLVHSFAPDAEDVLVLGLGAGVVPRHFKDDRKRVAVVEINKSALQAAIDHFGFDPQDISIHLEDARTFVRNCNRAYDVAVVDLFLGDGTPEYLMTKEFFRDLRDCLKADGVLVMNAFLDDENLEPNRRMLATIATSFPGLYLSGFLGGNSFIVGNSGMAPEQLQVEAEDMPLQIAYGVRFSVVNSQAVPREFFAGASPVTDEYNIFNVLFAESYLEMRRDVSRNYPPHLLVN